jgi:hypothetical protein
MPAPKLTEFQRLALKEALKAREAARLTYYTEHSLRAIGERFGVTARSVLNYARKIGVRSIGGKM